MAACAFQNDWVKMVDWHVYELIINTNEDEDDM